MRNHEDYQPSSHPLDLGIDDDDNYYEDDEYIDEFYTDDDLAEDAQDD